MWVVEAWDTGQSPYKRCYSLQHKRQATVYGWYKGRILLTVYKMAVSLSAFHCNKLVDLVYCSYRDLCLQDSDIDFYFIITKLLNSIDMYMSRILPLSQILRLTISITLKIKICNAREIILIREIGTRNQNKYAYVFEALHSSK